MARRLRNPELVTRLIEEIESRPCLWQVNHPYYHNRKKMNAAWQEISEKLDIPVNTIYLKWQTLRRFFTRMLRMENIKDIQEYKGGWPHFKAMWFLYKQIMLGKGADRNEDAFWPSIPDSWEEAMLRSIPDNWDETMPLSIPDNWEEAMARNISNTLEEAMPRNIANSLEEAMTESIPDSWDEAMQRSIPDSSERAMPGNITNGCEETMLRSIPDNWEEVMPRNIASSWEEAMAESIADSGEDVATEGGEVVVKYRPIPMKHDEISFAVQSNLTPANSRRESSDEDFDEMFLSSLTPYFKHLEPVRRLRVRSKIQELLIHELNDQTNSTLN
ncbi:PREDICTED: uncharacterized protein LOC106109851 [Papilio polytes]|uniref:uncharacterized protein LOC106109851 n=1 Tax=Papilio polytes TaxID=76194 RepID=UPI000676A75F|nr:PREDICTED: uncharacterized protein LOC106109851 [Papilio polytes]